MNTPIIDPQTLTEEQKQAIRLYYSKAKDFIESAHPFLVAEGDGKIILLEQLFGKELFKNLNNKNQITELKKCKYCVNHHCVHPCFNDVSCESWSLCDLYTPKD